jgi:hypothetical protein
MLITEKQFRNLKSDCCILVKSEIRIPKSKIQEGLLCNRP